MRINTTRSIDTANTVHDRYGSWHAAKTASTQRDGKFVVASSSAVRAVTTTTTTGTQKGDAAPKKVAGAAKAPSPTAPKAPKAAAPRK